MPANYVAVIIEAFLSRTWYNKYLRNLSQSPWIDKDDVRILNSVQELIEEGLNKFLQSSSTVFSSSGREDVDVRMLGRGRPFVFKMINPVNLENYNQDTMRKIQHYVNTMHYSRIRIRDLQIVSKESVARNLKAGEESKTKDYRALCCCSRELTESDIKQVNSTKEFSINQKTPIRVLHRRSLASRCRKIYKTSVEKVKLGDFDSVKPENLRNLFTLHLSTEAGTYIKEFVHGDFGRTRPSLADLLGHCDTDLMELDVMEVCLDWPPIIDEKDIIQDSKLNSTDSASDKMETSELSLSESYQEALKAMQSAESLPRGEKREELYKKARSLFERSMSLIEVLGLFSDNEQIEDVATNNLKYLLVPAYLAKIAISAECGPNRLDTFSRANVLLRSFFERIISYGLGESSIEQSLKSDELDVKPRIPPTLESATQSRNEKIERYKKMKVLEERLVELDRRINLGEEVDDEVAREYYMNLIKKWIQDSHESLEREVKPAMFFEKNRSGMSDEAETSRSNALPIDPTKSLTIVRDDLQKKAFGLGYPSKPTVTVDEFISKKIKDGDLAFQKHEPIYSNSLQRYAEQPTLLRDQEELSDTEREEKEDRDDEQELAKKRRWDEFKDDNPRGSGNRHNMG